MTARRMRHLLAIALAAWMMAIAAEAQAQDGLARARDLYLSAAYDEALVLLEQLKSQPSAAGVTEVEQYRMFCLLALNRGDEARKAIEEIVAADPGYQPSENQTSPRIRTVFQDTRKALLPGLVQRRYAHAKAAFERKDPQALDEFDQVLALLDDPDLKDAAQLADLRTVVTGFRDLSKAMATVPPPAPRPAEPVRAGQTAAAGPPIATVVDPPPPTRLDGPVGFTPPVVIAQPIPRWAPPAIVDRQGTFKGIVEVSIDENGNVTSATLQQSVHPLYDDKLLAMARTWKYKPALRNGVPTTSLKVVEIQLQPAR